VEPASTGRPAGVSIQRKNKITKKYVVVVNQLSVGAWGLPKSSHRRDWRWDMRNAIRKLVIYGVTVAVLTSSMLFAAITATNMAITHRIAPKDIYSLRW
jgi:hypothetical protein